MTLNDNWGYSAADHNHKSARYLVHLLTRSASAGANFLLNVGPTPLGEILPVHAERLKQVGQWLKQNGASVYGTRAGEILPTSAAVSTQRGGQHYVHVLEYISDAVKLHGVPQHIQQAHLLSTGQAVEWARQKDAFVLLLPAALRDAYDTVVVLS
jgi:alpha-L-fucosidase